MKPENRDEAYLWDIRQATDERAMIHMDARGALTRYFAPPLTDLERATAEREVGILGVM